MLPVPTLRIKEAFKQWIKLNQDKYHDQTRQFGLWFHWPGKRSLEEMCFESFGGPKRTQKKTVGRKKLQKTIHCFFHFLTAAVHGSATFLSSVCTRRYWNSTLLLRHIFNWGVQHHSSTSHFSLIFTLRFSLVRMALEGFTWNKHFRSKSVISEAQAFNGFRTVINRRAHPGLRTPKRIGLEFFWWATPGDKRCRFEIVYLYRWWWHYETPLPKSSGSLSTCFHRWSLSKGRFSKCPRTPSHDLDPNFCFTSWTPTTTCKLSRLAMIDFFQTWDTHSN